MELKTNDIKKLGELIRGIDVAMLTTECQDGSLHSRPMATQKRTFDGALWFFTREDSHKLRDQQGSGKANVAYASPESRRFVSVTGKMERISERSRFEEFWDPSFQAWFPQGLDEPHLCLLKIQVEKAEYWEMPQNAASGSTQNRKLGLVS